MASAEDAAGWDLAWLAVDANGELAAFITAGEGPIPSSALASALAEPGIEFQLLDLPESSEHELLIDGGNLSSFVALSRRGLFVFDWTDVHRTLRNSTQAYELVCRPSHRLSVKDLPAPLQAAARATTFANVVFSLAPSVAVAREA